MFRFLATNINQEHLDFLQTLRVLPPFQTVCDENGEFDLEQSCKPRWTSPVNPKDFYTHTVLRHIADVHLKKGIKTKRRQGPELEKVAKTIV